MRTTLTLEPDVAAALQRLSAEREMTWKELDNVALREGLHPLAIEHGLILCSRDADFARFSGLTRVDPLRSPPRVR